MTDFERACALWQMLDDIDTLDDSCRDHDDVFRERVRIIQKQRHAVLASDGYKLSRPDDADV